jgi:hypothetical protein
VGHVQLRSRVGLLRYLILMVFQIGSRLEP